MSTAAGRVTGTTGSRRLPGAARAKEAPRAMSRMARREAVARRRARMALIGACVFAVVVLATSLPLRTWLDQRAAVAATAATVRRLAHDNQELAAQAATLAKPATIRALAHRQFGYIEPGQKAYIVVPAGRSGSATSHSEAGQSALSQPVAAPGSPSSAEAVGIGSVSGASSTGVAGASARAGSSRRVSKRRGSPGFWTRVAHSLEFWG